MNITIANYSLVTEFDAEISTALLAAVKTTVCETLSHCEMWNSYMEPFKWFGDGWVFDEGTGYFEDAFTFMKNNTPIVTDISPKRGMPGQVTHHPLCIFCTGMDNTL